MKASRADKARFGGGTLSEKKRAEARIWDVLCQVVLTGLGFWIIWHYAAGTTPLRPDEYLWDSALFQVMGKLWADGLTPYVALFDHKGPLLFLAQKIAYHFSDPRMALYVLESLLVSLSLIFGYRTLRLRWGHALSLAGAVVTAVFWLPLMEYGNLCETHCMPWIMLAAYLQMRYLHSEKQEHPAGYAFVYGLCFGANVMIRPNNGILIAVITLMITIDLAVKKKWKNILCNALSLIAGVLTAVLPFVLYFHFKGALNAFIYATWTFNLIYAKSLEFALDFQSLRNVLFFITPALLCGFLGLVCVIRRRWLEMGVLVLAALSTLMITLSGIGYAHYFMLHVPLVVLALYMMRGLTEEGKGWKALLAVVCAGFVLLTFRTTLPYAKNNYLLPPTPEQAAQEQAYDDMVAALCDQIPQDERDQVAVCGLLVTDAEIFLKSDIQPVGRFCFLLEWHNRADNSVLKRFLATLRSGKAQWVISRDDGGMPEVASVLNEKYELHATETWQGTEYRLYHWK